MAWLAVLAALAGGTALAGFLERSWGWPTRLAAGLPLGLALLGLTGFPLASKLGLGAPALAGALMLTLLPAAALLVPAARAAWRLPAAAPPGRRAWVEPAAFVLAGLALVLTVERAMLSSELGIGIGAEHNYGDLPFHLAVISGFAWGDNYPPEHPELAGTRLTYPFLADFGVAQLVAGGLGLHAALRLQNALLALALLALAHAWALGHTRDRRAALFAPALLLLGGGLGFVAFAGDALRSGRGLGLLLELPRDYTIWREGTLRFGNFVTTLFIPQRALLLGLPLTLLAWSLLWRAVDPEAEETLARRRGLAAGLVAGLLPLAHSHCFAVALAVGGALLALFPQRRAACARFLALALLLGAPQAAWLARGSALSAGGFVGLAVGWDRGALDPFSFWAVNAGPFLALWLLALLRPGTLSPAQRRFALPFACCFVVPNLLRLSPWIWDNVKFLVHWYVGALPLVALVVARLSRRGRRGLALAAGLAVVLTASGALDVWRTLSRQLAYPVYAPAALAFAREVARRTPASARFVQQPTFDSPLWLSGRRSLLGYPGHVWSQGLAGAGREEDVRAIYAGGPRAVELLRRHQVSFVVVGPQELAAQAVDLAFFARLPVAAEAGPWRLYDVRPLTR